MEWLEHFILARDEAITQKNILAGWKGAGLFPENMQQVLQLLNTCPLATPVVTSSNDTATPFFLSSSSLNH